MSGSYCWQRCLRSPPAWPRASSSRCWQRRRFDQARRTTRRRRAAVHARRRATERLSKAITEAGKADFRIKVAVIGTRYDLGTAFSLYNKAQRYAEFLGLELSFQYRDRLLVVMPNGYGFSLNGKPDA